MHTHTMFTITPILGSFSFYVLVYRPYFDTLEGLHSFYPSSLRRSTQGCHIGVWSHQQTIIWTKLYHLDKNRVPGVHIVRSLTKVFIYSDYEFTYRYCISFQ